MNANDKSWSNETIALFDKLEAQIRQQQTEIDSLKDKLNLANKSLEIIEGWTK